MEISPYLFFSTLLGVTPVVLGSGSPLFKPGPGRINLKLLGTKPLKSGCLIARYQRDYVEDTGR